MQNLDYIRVFDILRLRLANDDDHLNDPMPLTNKNLIKEVNPRPSNDENSTIYPSLSAQLKIKSMIVYYLLTHWSNLLRMTN